MSFADPQTQMDIELKQREAMLQQQINELVKQANERAHTPFEETEDFRDFVVWLCGFTDRDSLPNEKDWEKLRDRTKQMAAQFALKAREDARRALQDKTPYQPDLFTVDTTAAPYVVTFPATDTTDNFTECWHNYTS